MLRAILLGIVQGLAEFLPVSSSGHLVVVPYLFSWRSPGLTLTVLLHLGTLLAAVAYFAGDLWYLASRSVWAPGHPIEEVRQARRAVGILALASLPAAVAGLLLQSLFERVFTQPLPVAGFFVVTAGLLYTAEVIKRHRAGEAVAVAAGMARFSARSRQTSVEPNAAATVAPGDATVGRPQPNERDERSITWIDALLIGCAQALALLPGISRSGSTIAAGMMRGLSRDAAARFSFLMLIPAVAGATIVRLPHLAAGDTGGLSTAEVIIAVAASALSGFWAIGYLLRLVRQEDLRPFVHYLLFAATLVVVGYLWIGPPSNI